MQQQKHHLKQINKIYNQKKTMQVWLFFTSVPTVQCFVCFFLCVSRILKSLQAGDLTTQTRSTDHGTTSLWAFFSGATNPGFHGSQKNEIMFFGLLLFVVVVVVVVVPVVVSFPLWTCCFFGGVVLQSIGGKTTQNQEINFQVKVSKGSK